MPAIKQRMNKRRPLGNSSSPGSWVSPGEAFMCMGSEACKPVRACVGLCVCLGPHPQSMPAVESCERTQARLGVGWGGYSHVPFSPPFSRVIFFGGGQMLLLMRTQGLGLQPGCPVSLETQRTSRVREQHCPEWLPDPGPQVSGY